MLAFIFKILKSEVADAMVAGRRRGCLDEFSQSEEQLEGWEGMKVRR